jgi:hypothetical protein
MLLKSHMDGESSPVRRIQVGLRIASNLRVSGFSRSGVTRVTLSQRAKNPLLP